MLPAVTVCCYQLLPCVVTCCYRLLPCVVTGCYRVLLPAVTVCCCRLLTCVVTGCYRVLLPAVTVCCYRVSPCVTGYVAGVSRRSGRVRVPPPPCPAARTVGTQATAPIRPARRPQKPGRRRPLATAYCTLSCSGRDAGPCRAPPPPPPPPWPAPAATAAAAAHRCFCGLVGSREALQFASPLRLPFSQPDARASDTPHRTGIGAIRFFGECLGLTGLLSEGVLGFCYQW